MWSERGQIRGLGAPTLSEPQLTLCGTQRRNFLSLGTFGYMMCLRKADVPCPWEGGVRMKGSLVGLGSGLVWSEVSATTGDVAMEEEEPS